MKVKRNRDPVNPLQSSIDRKVRRNRDVFVRNKLTAELNKGGGAAAKAAIAAQKLLGVTKGKFPVQDLPPHTPRDIQKDLDFLKERLTNTSPKAANRVSRAINNSVISHGHLTRDGPTNTISRTRLGKHDTSESDVHLPVIKNSAGGSVAGSHDRASVHRMFESDPAYSPTKHLGRLQRLSDNRSEFAFDKKSMSSD